jgi:carotenoid 1,2-hydratase
MKIISDHTLDVRKADKAAGGYEWWYFDGWDEKHELGFVIIFYDGNPFSTRYIEQSEKAPMYPSQFPAISISVYKQGKPIYYSFTEAKENEASFSSEVSAGQVLNNSFSCSLEERTLTYHILLDEELPTGDRLKGELNFRGVTGQKGFGDEKDDDHLWNLIQSRADVRGELRVNGKAHTFEGSGYHDHNFGEEPMDHSFTDWYWGRFHIGQKSLVYYVMNTKEGQDYRAWLFDQEGRMEGEFNDIRYEDFRTNFFGLKSARKLDLSGDGLKASIQLSKILDNGPFYQRFRSELILQQGEDMYTSRGISEYIHPARIKKKLFWPLVKMRILRRESPHWVQKSKTLYRWTW